MLFEVSMENVDENGYVGEGEMYIGFPQIKPVSFDELLENPDFIATLKKKGFYHFGDEGFPEKQEYANEFYAVESNSGGYLNAYPCGNTEKYKPHYGCEYVRFVQVINPNCDSELGKEAKKVNNKIEDEIKKKQAKIKQDLKEKELKGEKKRLAQIEKAKKLLKDAGEL